MKVGSYTDGFLYCNVTPPEYERSLIFVMLERNRLITCRSLCNSIRSGRKPVQDSFSDYKRLGNTLFQFTATSKLVNDTFGCEVFGRYRPKVPSVHEFCYISLQHNSLGTLLELLHHLIKEGFLHSHILQLARSAERTVQANLDGIRIFRPQFTPNPVSKPSGRPVQCVWISLVIFCWNMRLLDVETSCDDKNMIILSMNDCLNYLGRMVVVG